MSIWRFMWISGEFGAFFGENRWKMSCLSLFSTSFWKGSCCFRGPFGLLDTFGRPDYLGGGAGCFRGRRRGLAPRENVGRSGEPPNGRSPGALKAMGLGSGQVPG